MKFKNIKKLDTIVVLIIIIAAVGMVFGMSVFKKEGKGIEITVDGEVYKTVSLSSDDEIEINETNTLVIKDGKASMKTADCDDQVCVNHAPISSIDDTIVCLPNKIVLKVVSTYSTDINNSAW